MSGTGVLVTRPAGEADPLVEELRRRGIEVRAVPTVALEPITFEAPDLAAYDWVVVTSATGARSLLAPTGLQPGCSSPRGAGGGRTNPREQMQVEFPDLAHHPPAAEPLAAEGASGDTHAAGEVGIGEYRGDGVRQRGRVSGGDQQPGHAVLDH